MKAWVKWIGWILFILAILGLMYYAWCLGKTAILWLFILYFG